MPILMKLHPGHATGLVAVCDVCAAVVKSAAAANVLWLKGELKTPGETCGFRIACKACDRIAEARWGCHHWQPLDIALAYLANNTRIDFPQAARLAGLHSRLGWTPRATNHKSRSAA